MPFATADHLLFLTTSDIILYTSVRIKVFLRKPPKRNRRSASSGHGRTMGRVYGMRAHSDIRTETGRVFAGRGATITPWYFLPDVRSVCRRTPCPFLSVCSRKHCISTSRCPAGCPPSASVSGSGRSHLCYEGMRYCLFCYVK